MNWSRLSLLAAGFVAADLSAALSQSTPASALRVGLPAADSFTYATRQPDFSARIPLVADQAGTFRFTVTPLVSTDGSVAPVAFRLEAIATPDSARSIRLEKSAEATLLLNANLPGIGVYRGSFTVLTADSRLTRAYTVTWGRRASPVTVTGAGASAVTLGAGSDVTIPFALHDTTSAAVQVYPVRLDELRWVRNGDTTFSVPIGKMSVRRSGTSQILDTIRLGPNASESLELVVENALARGAGAYQGALRVAGPDFAALSVPVKLLARRAWWMAALLILLGIVIAEFVRRIQDDVRPRLTRQRRCAALLASLAEIDTRISTGGGSDQEEADVIATLTGRLRTLYADPGLGTRQDVDAELADLARRMERIPEWTNVHRTVENLQPASLRAPLRVELRKVTDFLLHRGVADEAAGKVAESTLLDLPAAIQEARRKHLATRIEEFQKQVREERAAHGSSETLLARLQKDVEALLDDALAAVNGERLDDGRAAFDRARVRYVDLLAADLRIRLGGARPDWMNDATWIGVKNGVDAEVARIGAAVTPEEKLAAYARAQGLYLRELAGTLQEAATALLAAGPTAEEEELLRTIATAAVSAQSIAAIPDLQGAVSAMKAAEEAWDSYRAARKKSGVPQGVTGPTAPAGVPGQVPDHIPAATSIRTIARTVVPLAPETITSRITLLDWGITALAAVLAVVLGINLLWAPDLTWGTAGDVFAALFWGLGVQQTGNATFRGLANVLAQVGGKPAGGA